MVEEWIKKIWETIVWDAVFKSKQCFCLKLYRKWNLVVSSKDADSFEGLLLPSQIAAGLYMQRSHALCWCLSSGRLGCHRLPNPSPKRITCVPFLRQGLPFLPAATSSTVKCLLSPGFVQLLPSDSALFDVLQASINWCLSFTVFLLSLLYCLPRD